MSETIKHTPTPWDWSKGEATDCDIVTSYSGVIAVMEHNHVAGIDGPANAAFIVRACNSPDAMLAALKRQVDNIELWLLTGVPATKCQSQSIYEQMAAAIKLGEGK
jgi:hypothetical protein